MTDGENIESKHYSLVAGDIRETEQLEEKLKVLGVDPKAPTLILTECVLVYLKPEDSRKILGFIKTFFTGDAAVLNYEMIKPDDPFGRVMLENLEASNLVSNICRIEVAGSSAFTNVPQRRRKSSG